MNYKFLHELNIFILFISMTCLIGPLYFLIDENIEFRYVSYKNLFYINFMFLFPVFIVLFFYFKKKVKNITTNSKANFGALLSLWFLFICLNTFFSFLTSFDYCDYFDKEKILINENGKIITKATHGCGIFGKDREVFIINTPLLYIFNKYEEIDTNTLDLTNWEKL